MLDLDSSGNLYNIRLYKSCLEPSLQAIESYNLRSKVSKAPTCSFSVFARIRNGSRAAIYNSAVIKSAIISSFDKRFDKMLSVGNQQAETESATTTTLPVVAFCISKKEQYSPSNGFKNLQRRLRGQYKIVM
jgi:hypothetical protein